MNYLGVQRDHSLALESRYTRMISDRPHLAGLLSDLRDTHRAHAAELAAALAAESAEDSDVTLMATLWRQEAAAATEAAAACVAAESRHAALLGSIAAALATHRVLLEDVLCAPHAPPGAGPRGDSRCQDRNSAVTSASASQASDASRDQPRSSVRMK